MAVQSGKATRQGSLAWYLRRLQIMPPAEIPHRAREAVLRQACRAPLVAARDQRLPRGLSAGDLPRLPMPRNPAGRIVPEGCLQQLERDVDRLCAGHLDLLGQSWSGQELTDWARDPESGRRWPWHRYTYAMSRRPGAAAGDVKFVWELSRLQHLQVLALGAHLLGRADAASLCCRHLSQWLQDNPPYRGLGYASGIEAASRVVSIVLILTFLEEHHLSGDLVKDIGRALASHGRWIARFPSLYSSANNHLVAESAALYLLGSLMPVLPEAGNWKDVGWARLVKESERQVLSDGTGAEQTPQYLAYTLEWLLLARTVDRAGDTGNESALDKALYRGARYLSHVADQQGNIPFIGDCDDAVVVRPVMEDANHPGSVVIAIASALQDGSLVHPAFAADVRTWLLGGKEVPASGYGFASNTFEEGGYSVLRSRSKDGELFLMMDHGPLGFAETCGHGHADALAVWLHVDGVPLLVDFGTFRYNADAGWRDWARSTASHNTLELNDCAQSEMTGPFVWGRRARTTLIESGTGRDASFVRARHDGYSGNFGVVHERLVERTGESGFVIHDELTGAGRHRARLSFHFAPHVGLRPLGNGRFEARVADKPVAQIRFDSPGLEVNLIQQKQPLRPGAGAVSPGYSRLSPAPSLVATGMIDVPFSCRTTISRA